jgi:hypothetical protein
MYIFVRILALWSDTAFIVGDIYFIINHKYIISGRTWDISNSFCKINSVRQIA